jgi:hypothetical protein
VTFANDASGMFLAHSKRVWHSCAWRPVSQSKGSFSGNIPCAKSAFGEAIFKTKMLKLIITHPQCGGFAGQVPLSCVELLDKTSNNRAIVQK